MRPIFLKKRQNLPIFFFNTFVGASRCSVSNFDYLALIRESFDKIFLILQNSTLFCPNFHNFDTLIHVCYIKNKEKFSLCAKFEFSQNSLVKFQFFLHIYIVPIPNKPGEVKNVPGNLLLITMNF